MVIETMNKFSYALLLLLVTTFNYLLASEDSTCFTTPLSDSKGIQMLLESKHRCSYWPLSQYYETQITDTFCGVASSVMVLNAMAIEKPKIPHLNNHGLFMQDSFFDGKVSEIVSKDVALKKGFTLDELACALQTFNIHPHFVYSAEITEDDFRDMVKLYCSRKDRFIIANYYRPIIQQKGGGHFSPIAAYNETEDALLVLDVSRYKYTATWVNLPQFFASTQTMDKDAKKSRGFILIDK